MSAAPHFDAPFDLTPLLELLAHKRFVALTGAGCSTESGIPDYRGPETRKKARNPTRYQDYIKTPEARSRYWSRSAIGWPRMRDTLPNAAHIALHQLETQGNLTGLITQNVDRLHQRAGSRRVIELHGALAEVTCLSCHELESRDAFQQRLLSLNPHHHQLRHAPVESAPDGDAELDPDALALRELLVPSCRRCLEGVLKPHVVFFGENVPKERVARAMSLLEESEALLVAGSSLAVYSGLRFVRRAKELGLPIAILTIGETRGDALADLKLEAPLGAALSQLAERLPPLAR